jgi:hypothetical protein
MSYEKKEYIRLKNIYINLKQTGGGSPCEDCKNNPDLCPKCNTLRDLETKCTLLIKKITEYLKEPVMTKEEYDEANRKQYNIFVEDHKLIQDNIGKLDSKEFGSVTTLSTRLKDSAKISIISLLDSNITKTLQEDQEKKAITNNIINLYDQVVQLNDTIIDLLDTFKTILDYKQIKDNWINIKNKYKSIKYKPIVNALKKIGIPFPKEDLESEDTPSKKPTLKTPKPATPTKPKQRGLFGLSS